MLIVRLAKVALVAAVGVFAFIVAYDSNYAFVRHVLSMDTTFPNNALMSRAITDPRVWSAAYALIIASEGRQPCSRSSAPWHCSRASGPRRQCSTAPKSGRSRA